MAFLFFGLGFVCAFLSTYLYFFIKRFCKVFAIGEENRRSKIIKLAISVAISAVAVTFFGYGLVFILYMALADGVLSIIRLVLCKTLWKAKGEPKFSCRLIKSGISAILFSTLVIVFGIINFHNVVKTEYTIYTDKNIRPEGYKVAFISDIHFGISLDLEELSEICNEISREKPDIVILGGDIIDNSTNREDIPPLFETLGKIESRYGVFYIFGNHDRSMAMVENALSDDELVSAIENAGIVILKDKVQEINDDFVLIGREDRGFHNAKREEIEKLLSEVRKDKFILTLDHQPTEFDKNREAGTNLLISGHTHGGQVWPVNIIDNIFKMNEANYGYVKIGDNTSAIVSSGLAGWGFSVKTSAPAEYVIVNIKKR
ncbi:MAG: metallophosphoesterase [Ruminococcaceae bacterium]|nr:metallophosphoesterase [Oscillospiraceae bacterium]